MFCSTRMSPESDAIPEPVAQAILVRAFALTLLLGRSRRVVVARDGGDLAQRAGLDLLGDGGDRRGVAALEADIDALIRLYALGDFESLLCLAMSMPTGFSQ